MSGPEFQDLKPLAPGGFFSPFFLAQAYSYGGLNQGVIHPVLPPGPVRSLDCFREGETLLIYLEVGFPLKQIINNPDGTYVSGLRCRPWFLRSNVEFRTPGDSAQSAGNPPGAMGGLKGGPGSPACPSQIDHDVFGGWSIFNHPFDPTNQFALVNTNPANAGGGLGLGNRNVWMASPKRLDTVPAAWGSPPLNIAVPPTTSDSVLFDDVWYIPLPNPSVAPWKDPPWILGTPVAGVPPNYRQNKVFTYPCFGRALGCTFEPVLAYLATDLPVPYTGIPVPPGPNGGVYPSIRIGYRAGVTHSIIQERVG